MFNNEINDWVSFDTYAQDDYPGVSKYKEMLYDFITSIQGLRKALSRELKNFDMSVSRLSQLSEVPVSVINAFLEGHTRLKIDSFLKIANALGEEIVIQ